jgi:D-threo-aldose 1-dehydrogenase
MTQPSTTPRATDLVTVGNGVQLTRLGYGTATQGGLLQAVSELEAQAVFQTAWDAGLRYFDTAPWYGLGSSEERLGAFLHGKSGYALSSKVGRLLGADYPPHPTQFQPSGAPAFDTPSRLNVRYDYSYDAAMRSLEDSLRRLNVARIDLAFIHDPDIGGASVQEVVEGCGRALLELRDGGVIGAVGAGMNQWQMPLELARAAPFDVFLLAGRFTLLEQASLPFMDHCARHGIGVIVGGVYNSGLLTNPKPGAHYDYVPVPPDVLTRALALQAICERHGVPLRAAALQFPFRHPAVVSVLIAARTTRQLEDNLRMFQMPIPDELWSALEREGMLEPSRLETGDSATKPEAS